MNLLEEIKQIASEIKEDVVTKRRHLHRNPELSFREFNTSAFIKESLDRIGIPWSSIAGTGVMATIEGKCPSSRVIALRADIDALPIVEKTELPYRSVNEGVMHACGHDVHTASLLGVAEILARLRDRFNGTVKFIFQPGEEILPGGAIGVIEEGALTDPQVSVIIGQHVMPSIKNGKIGIKRGAFMASMDEIRIKISGKGGHGAEPHKNTDPVAVAATVIVSLQQIVSRSNNPDTPTVLSFGKIEANGAINIIPDDVLIEGTFRTMDEKWREEAHRKIRNITESIAEGFGCKATVDIRKGYPCLYNNDKLTDQLYTFIRDYAGAENIEEWGIWMASEDFAYYSHETDACFYLLGVGRHDQENAQLHTSYFNVDEESLELSIGLMSYVALKVLGN